SFQPSGRTPARRLFLFPGRSEQIRERDFVDYRVFRIDAAREAVALHVDVEQGPGQVSLRVRTRHTRDTDDGSVLRIGSDAGVGDGGAQAREGEHRPFRIVRRIDLEEEEVLPADD